MKFLLSVANEKFLIESSNAPEQLAHIMAIMLSAVAVESGYMPGLHSNVYYRKSDQFSIEKVNDDIEVFASHTAYHEHYKKVQAQDEAMKKEKESKPSPQPPTSP